MNAVVFFIKVGYWPRWDDLTRVNCKQSGQVGHLACGWCGKHKEPRFACGCLAGETQEGDMMTITERRPTLTDCGCEATVYADGSGIELHYCPMHEAAKELLEALRNLVTAEKDYGNDPCLTTRVQMDFALRDGRNAVAKAEEETCSA